MSPSSSHIDEEPSSPDEAGSPMEGGHSAALARLFREHNRSLQSFLTARLGNAHEAQEVAQEAYARLLQLNEPGAVSFLRAYLFKTAVNIAMDRARQRTVRARLDGLTPELPEEPVDSITPDRRLLASEELDLVERALNELPRKYRRAFVLHRFENWSTEQIASELGVQKRMVRNYICRTATYCKLRLDGQTPAQARQQVIP